MRPDVVGDRRILRFLRGQDHNVDLAIAKYKSFLSWREANNVDLIRFTDSPTDFPNGSKILRLVPQIVIAHDALDRSGCPIALETFNFSPADVLEAQLSHEAEEKLKKSRGYEELLRNGGDITFGTLLSCLIIRDFEGLGLHHVSGDGQAVLKLILDIAVANYPEQQYRCHLINLPWFFSSVWFVLRNMFDKRMLQKLTMSGGRQEYLKKLLLDMEMDSIPVQLGGRYSGYNTPFTFDLSSSGPFYYSSCPYLSSAVVAPIATRSKEEDEQTE
eukprot:gene19519-19950_t